MKVITYHYIKSFNKKYPYSNFLDKKKFKKQLIFFEKKFGIINNVCGYANYQNFKKKPFELPRYDCNLF